MLTKAQIVFISLAVVTILFGCNQKTKLFYNQLGGLSSQDFLMNDSTKFTTFNCTFISDTLVSQPSYEVAFEQLKLIIDSVNQRHPRAYANYINAIYLAEFVYNNCAFQFLGSLFQDSSKVAIPNWSNLTLKQMFEVANTNKRAVWCGDRTVYFAKMVKLFLNLEVKTIHVKGVHSYPLVLIDGLYYLIDPYYPTIIISTEDGSIADYNWLQKNTHQKNIAIKLTPRMFGNSRTLISSELVHYMTDETKLKKPAICKLIFEFLNKKKSYLIALRRGKHTPLVNFNCPVVPLTNSSFPFTFNSNILVPVYSKGSFCQQYGLYYYKLNVN